MHKKKRNILDEALYSCRIVVIYTLLFSFISNIMMLALPLYSLQVLDRVISSRSVDTLVMLSVVVFAAFVCLSLIQASRSFLLIRLGDWLEKKLSSDLLQHSIAVASFSKVINGSQNLRDLSTLKGFLTGPALSSLFDAPWAIIFIIVLFMIHPAHGIVSLVGGVILFILAYINEKTTKKILESANEDSIKSMNQVEIATRNAEVIEAMGMGRNVTKNWQVINKDVLYLQSLASSRSAIISGISKFFRMFIQMVIIAAGGYLVLNDKLTVGAIIAGSILVGRALAPFEASITSWKGIVTARKSYSRLTKSLENENFRPKAMSLPTPHGKLFLENVVYAAPGMKKPILKNISFQLEPGEIMGMIGPSASGKSTLAKLITSIWKPASGYVRLDGADIYAWDRDDIGNHLGYLPQDIELFNGSIKLNIARMDKDADTAKIVEAAKIAGVHEMILSLPNGYETEIGIGGSVLSAGQRQRVALARAFYGAPKLIVLDEPNSNLDQEGDAALVAALKYAKEKNITTIIVSHRPSIMSCVDKILVLKDGAVVAFGPTKEVLEKLRGTSG